MSNPWQRWHMDAFDAPQSQAIAAEPETLDMARVLEEIKELRALAQTQGHAEGYAKGIEQGKQEGHSLGLQTGHTEGHTKGLEQGHKEGYEKGLQVAHLEAERLSQLAERSEHALSHLHQDIGQALLALAVDIAEHVLHTELRQYPEQLLPLIKEVLQDAEQSEQPLTLAVNPDEASLIERLLADDLAHHNWRIKADPSISAGGVEVKTPLGHVDATLESRWTRAIARLGPLKNSISHD